MNGSFVAIDSTWDQSTAAATKFRADNVHSHLQQAGLTPNELAGENANQQQAEQAAKAPGVVYLTGVSHGTGSSFTGDQDRPVFETGGYDPADVQGKIIHFLACNTALFLGRNMVEVGKATAFFGYKGLFAWPDEGGTLYSDIFFDCDAEIDRSLAANETAGTAGQRAIAKFGQAIDSLKAQGGTANLYAASLLETNRSLLRSPCDGTEYGSTDARLGSPPPTV